MRVKSYMCITTNIATNDYYPENEDSNHRLIEYLEDKIYKVTKSSVRPQKGTLDVKNFGQVSYTIDTNVDIDSYYEGSLIAEFEYSDDLALSEKYVGEALSTAFLNDNSSYDKLKEAVNNFISIFNDSIKSIIIPEDEQYLFYCEDFYIKSYKGSNYTINWVPILYLSDDSNFNAMVENIPEYN